MGFNTKKEVNAREEIQMRGNLMNCKKESKRKANDLMYLRCLPDDLKILAKLLIPLKPLGNGAQR